MPKFRCDTSSLSGNYSIFLTPCSPQHAGPSIYNGRLVSSNEAKNVISNWNAIKPGLMSSTAGSQSTWNGKCTGFLHVSPPKGSYYPFTKFELDPLCLSRHPNEGQTFCCMLKYFMSLLCQKCMLIIGCKDDKQRANIQRRISQRKKAIQDKPTVGRLLKLASVKWPHAPIIFHY